MVKRSKQYVFSSTSIVRTNVLTWMATFAVMCFPLVAQATELIFTPPFGDAHSSSLPIEYPHNFGAGFTRSLTNIDLDSGTIHQKVFTAAHMVGGQCINGIDEIYREFTVPESGTYQISFSCSITGTLHAAGFTYFLGVGKSSFLLELQANVGAVNCTKQELFKTDLGWGSFLTDVVLQDSILALLNATAPGTGEILGLMGQISDNVTPVMAWDSEQFTLHFTGNLQEGQPYIWSFCPHTAVGSVALGIAEEVAFENVDIVLQEVRITRLEVTGNQPPETPEVISPEPGQTDVNLTPTLEASAFSDPDGDNHEATRWQIANDGGFADANIVYDSGEISPCIELQVPAEVLQHDSAYYWRVQYKDDCNDWSDWSAAEDFRTVVSSHIMGYVKDADSGNGINATLYVCRADDSMIYRRWGSLAPSGIFGIPVPAGDYYLLVTAGGKDNEKTYSHKLTRVPEGGAILVDPNQILNVGDINLPDVPDLRGESFDIADSLVQWGQVVSASYSCANRGTEASGSCKLNYYLSANDMISEYDVFLREVVVPSLDPDELYNSAIDLTLPDTSPNNLPSSGCYYIGMIVDPNDEVDESDEFYNANRGFGIDKDRVVILNKADLDRNCRVNFEDFAVIARCWLGDCSEPNWCEGSDFDKSGQVDFNDLGILVDSWLWNLFGLVPVGHFDVGEGEAVYSVALSGDILLVGTGAPSTSPPGSFLSIDVSNPVNPALLDEIAINDCVLDVEIRGNLAYLATAFHGLQIIDIADPCELQIIGTCPDSSPDYYDVDVVGQYAFVADHWDGLKVIDVSDPCNPDLIKTKSLSGYEHGVATSGDGMVYLACGHSTSYLRVVDVADPCNPTLVESCAIGGYPAISNIVYREGLVYVVHQSGFEIVDVSVPTSPTVISPTVSFSNYGHDIALDPGGCIAFVASEADGLVLVDVTDPTNPFQWCAYDLTSAGRNVDADDQLVCVGLYEGVVQIFQKDGW